jgi:2-dehydro-3-deoxyphosphogluconate aldolase/(4S)-4-hydroxy-2-oxoglutarate aldolase
MARFKRLDVLRAMIESGLVPVFYHKDLETAKRVARAADDGGVKVLEFTNRGDFACQIFTELIQWCEREMPELILGVGSVVDPGTASLYINNGANFVVGPILNAEVAKVCNRRKVPYLPGCGSASEISQAEEYGVEICKIFPGKEVGGAAFVKNILGPMPWTLIMPTGGVETTRESIDAWFKAGVACVGIGSTLISKELIAAGNFSAIAEKMSSTGSTKRGAARCLWGSSMSAFIRTLRPAGRRLPSGMWIRSGSTGQRGPLHPLSPLSDRAGSRS